MCVCFFFLHSVILIKQFETFSQRNTDHLTHQRSGPGRRCHKSRRLKPRRKASSVELRISHILMSGLFHKYRRLPRTAFMLKAVTDDRHICRRSAEEPCGCRSLRSYKGVACRRIQRFCHSLLSILTQDLQAQLRHCSCRLSVVFVGL